MNREGRLSEELASFRQEWAEELYKDEDGNESSSVFIEDNAKSNSEERAFHLFLKATQLEKEKDFTAAVFYYREATRICPEIEIKVTEYQRQQYLNEQNEEETIDEEENETSIQLENIIQQLTVLNVTGLCAPELPQNGTHISNLPTELLMNVVKWIVSKDLDIHSLGNFAQTCKWFYACGKDQELWKLICMRMFGLKGCNPKQYENSWQRMYIQRPHLKFNGVYISESTYIRQGQPSLDSFYKPFHIITHYRVLRFFPDGRCAILISAEGPKQAIQILKSQPFQDPDIHVGYYRMNSDESVSIFHSRFTKPSALEMQKRKNKNKNVVQDIRELNFLMQLQLEHTRKRRNNKLSWESYHCTIKHSMTGTTTENPFDLKQYKPYLFSRVKGYTSYSNSCLGE